MGKLMGPNLRRRKMLVATLGTRCRPKVQIQALARAAQRQLHPLARRPMPVIKCQLQQPLQRRLMANLPLQRIPVIKWRQFQSRTLMRVIKWRQLQSQTYTRVIRWHQLQSPTRMLGTKSANRRSQPMRLAQHLQVEQ